MIAEKSSKLSDRVLVRQLRAEEIDEAETIVRLAFGTFLQIPDLLQNPDESELIPHRWRRNPQDVLAAELDGKLVGTNVVTRWGSFAYFGPLTVSPELWDSGIASKLLEATMQIFNRWGVSCSGLFTFANSPKHVSLYHKFGYYARFLNAVMTKEVPASNSSEKRSEYSTFSSLDAKEKQRILEQCQKLTSGHYPGFDLSSEILLVDDQRLGDTLILQESGSVVSFAICQSGPKTEAGKEKCAVKFGAVKIGSGMEKRFENLLDAAQSYTLSRGVSKLESGVNLSHAAAFDAMLKDGFRISFQGVEMQKPNAPAFDREQTFVLNDLR